MGIPLLLMIPAGVLASGAYYCAQKAYIEYEFEDYIAAGGIGVLSALSALSAAFCIYGAFAFHV